MKTWAVTIRSADGRRMVENVEAEDRAAVFAELEKRGLTAVSVEEARPGKRKAAGSRYAGAKARSPWRGLVAGAVVIMLALGAWHWLVPKTPRREAAAEASAGVKLIAEVSPATNVAVRAEEAKPKPLPRQKTDEVRNGMRMLSNGKLVPADKVRTIKASDRQMRFRYHIFEQPVDNELAFLLTLKSGEMVVGGPIPHQDLRAELQKAFETPIIVKEDDAEDVKEVKRAVIAARKDLKDAMDRGEDPQTLLDETYDEANRLALYRETIETQVKKSLKAGELTDEQLDDLMKAADKMLEEKGIAPLKVGPLMRTRLKILRK